jgi:hypothetical protein
MQSITGFLALILVVGLVSCKKNKLNKQTTSSEDNTIAESMFDDIFNITDRFDDTEDDVAGSNKTYYWPDDTTYVHMLYSCLEITKQFIDSATFERTITFDFGTTGCTTIGGRVRKGKIIAHRIGKHREGGSSTVITPDGYVVDDYAVEGTKTYINLGLNSDDQHQYSVDVTGEITTPDNETITLNSTRTRTWVEGFNTGFSWNLDTDGTYSLAFNGMAGIYDDVWEITGSGDGINSEGRSFDVEIATLLRVQWCSPYIEVSEGVIELKPEDLKLRTIDFGDGTCDNEATVSIGDNSYVYEMRKN